MCEEFKAKIQATKTFLAKYSVRDIAFSLFTSSVWLPNISSPVKHQFITTVFLSLSEDKFQENDKIGNYSDFKEFLTYLYKIVPQFEFYEDYIPELDWGEIKFFLDDKFYSIFYGSEIENVYDFLYYFEIIHCSFDSEYSQILNRSPHSELSLCLSLQDKIISNISNQIAREKVNIKKSGSTEIPSKNFWSECFHFLSNFIEVVSYEGDSLQYYTTHLGKTDNSKLEYNIFINSVSDGSIIPFYFVSVKDKFYPLLPRRYSSILIENWGDILKQNYKKIGKDLSEINMKMQGSLLRFVSQRLEKKYLFPFISLLKNDKIPFDLVFFSAILSKDYLFCIYLTNPLFSSTLIYRELNNVKQIVLESFNSFENQFFKLFSHFDRKFIQFSSEKNEKKLSPILITVIPQVSVEFDAFKIPKDFPGIVVTLDQFLGIVDELEKVGELADFNDYLIEHSGIINQPFIRIIDMFGSFKDSYGTIIEGATIPDALYLDPHWGSNRRFETLRDFWKLFPNHNFFNHPRSWKVVKEGATRIRLEAKSFLGAALYSKVVSTNIFINSPFDKMSYEQAQLSNLLMEIIEWSFSHDQHIFSHHPFFDIYTELQIILFPVSLVQQNENFNHILHLSPEDKLWQFDHGFIKDLKPGIRVVFNDEQLRYKLSQVQDRSIEIDLIKSILIEINQILPIDKLQNIIDQLDKTSHNKPRFKVFVERKKAAFPDLIHPNKPKISDFKLARKEIAKIVKEIGIEPGEYQAASAKKKINSILVKLVESLNTKIDSYNFKNSISFLLSRIGALNDEEDVNSLNLKSSLNQEVHFDIEKTYSFQYTEYRRMHKNYRYLIEKFVQLSPHGTVSLDKDNFQYLIAFVDWIITFYSVSDSLHYEIDTIGIQIHDDYRIDTISSKESEQKQKLFSQELSKLELGIIGKKEDKVSVLDKVDTLLDSLDEAFKLEFSFSLKNMSAMLEFFTYWPQYKTDQNDKSSYSATIDEISEVASNNISAISTDEIEKIINFLILKSDEVISILGQETKCSDIPIWEFEKRFSRYNIRPLIKLENLYYWEPYSTLRSVSIWTGTPFEGRFLYYPAHKKISDVVNKHKKLIEARLVDEGINILKRYTPYIEKNIKLHKRDKTGNHPYILGDFDILAYIQEKNILLNIECKDIYQVHCLKDAKRLREKIFGRHKRSKGFIGQINTRDAYLENNSNRILSLLGWPNSGSLDLKVVSIFLTRKSYWWTMFPPVDTKIRFTRLELFNDLLKNL